MPAPGGVIGSGATELVVADVPKVLRMALLPDDLMNALEAGYCGEIRQGDMPRCGQEQRAQLLWAQSLLTAG